MDINNIEPKYWGKNGWIFLNSIALTYKPENREKYKIFIEQLPYILPCKKCGDNMKNNLSTLDKALESKQNFIEWLINIRNEIYLENKKCDNQIKQVSLSDTLNEIYTKDNSNMYIMIIVLFVVFILLVLLLNYYRQINN